MRGGPVFLRRVDLWGKKNFFRALSSRGLAAEVRNEFATFIFLMDDLDLPHI